VISKSSLQASLHTRDNNSQSSGSKDQFSRSGTIVVSQSIPRSTTMRIMTDDLRMLVFNGNGSQDLEQHMFVCEVIWTDK